MRDPESSQDVEEEISPIAAQVPMGDDGETPAAVFDEEQAERQEEAETGGAAKPEIIEPTDMYLHQKVESIEFSVFSPKMIKKMAEAKIVTPELYDKEGYPVDGGLMDVRLGVIDPGLVCKTDNLRLKDTLGHFGYIELARPVIHISFVTVILNLLRNTCSACSRALSPKQKIDIAADATEEEKQKAKHAAAAAPNKSAAKCPFCKMKQGKVTLEKPTTFMEDDKRVSPIEVRTRLEKVTDEELELFGMNPRSFRPEWAVLTVLPIPPVTMRPSITLESGERSEDDLTHKLGDIVRINQRLFENINAGAPEIIIEDLWDLLQYHITTFFDNDVAQLPPARHRSGQPLKTLSERIKSKEGRIRHNLTGKRTNFSARTVISPDPMLKLSEVGVPKIIAMKLTVPERVTEWNMNYLKKFIEKGPNDYPGANYVIRPDGKKKKITDETKEASLEELQPGYVVERHLLDGDIALFNRQPSLHRMSMMCHRIKVLPYRTLRLNPAVCHPYNADFDGDEMNLHIPQTEEARAEAEILMEVQTQLISPRYGLSVIGCVQDAISGSYLLTQDSTTMSRNEAVDLLARAGLTDFSNLTKKDMVSGKEIFSTILPDDFNFIGKDRQNRPVRIVKGKLIEGVMDRANLGEGSGLLLRNIHSRYGQEFAIDLLGKLFRLGINSLLRVGFTAALGDTDLHEKARDLIETTKSDAETEVGRLIELFQSGQLEAFPGKTTRETLELKILELLNKARNKVGTIISEQLNQASHTMVMARSGARGNIINLAQMAACVGQQAMRGKRIENGYRGRTLSCFKRNDHSPAAHGFVRNGFKNGMKPYEFFFAALTGRDSLMDTALRTPKSGYLYRRLSNAMQDVRVEYDGTVRDSGGKIIQFSYGEDGIDVSRSEGGIINVERVLTNME